MGDRGVPLPHVLGHEILGEVVRGGPDADPVPTGATKLIPSVDRLRGMFGL